MKIQTLAELNNKRWRHAEIEAKKRGVHVCPMCLEDMTMQVDSITKKKSKYLWRCKKCMPKNIIMSIG